MNIKKYRYLSTEQEFDGKSNVLSLFIKPCDQICSIYLSNAPCNELSKLCLIKQNYWTNYNCSALLDETALNSFVTHKGHLKNSFSTKNVFSAMKPHTGLLVK